MLGCQVSRRAHLAGQRHYVTVAPRDREEVNGESNGPERLHLVIDVRRDCLSAAWLDDDISDGVGASYKTQLALEDDDPTPRPPVEVARDAQSGGHCVLVPLWSCPDQLEPVGEFSSIAERAGEQCPDSRLPPFGV